MRNIDRLAALVRSAPHRAVAVAALAVLALFGGTSTAGSESGGDALETTGRYAGVFAGSGRLDNRFVDVAGFANWGNPGSTVDYDDSRFMIGGLLGRTFEIDGTTFRIEFDAALGSPSAETSELDPTCPDETANSRLRWSATARVGIEETVGPATVFATGGLAAARIANSVTDIDYVGSCLETGLHPDPDDSFRDASTHLGWVIGVGLEAPLADGWTLRLDGSYLDFGRSTYDVNRSGDNRCGRGGDRAPCPYGVENRFNLVRVAIVRRFGR